MLHEETTNTIIASAIAVHRAIGPGLAEHSYQAAMAIEMNEQGLKFEREPLLSVSYREQRLATIAPTSSSKSEWLSS